MYCHFIPIKSPNIVGSFETMLCGYKFVFIDKSGCPISNKLRIRVTPNNVRLFLLHFTVPLNRARKDVTRLLTM